MIKICCGHGLIRLHFVSSQHFEHCTFFSRSIKGSPTWQKKRNKRKLLTLSFFDVVIHRESNLHVISDKLEWSPVPHLRKLLRFTKGFYRLVNSKTGGFSFLQVSFNKKEKEKKRKPTILSSVRVSIEWGPSSSRNGTYNRFRRMSTRWRRFSNIPLLSICRYIVNPRVLALQFDRRWYSLGRKLQGLNYLVKLIQQKQTISPPQEIETQGFFKACRQHGQHFLFPKKTPPCYEALCLDELLLKITRAAVAMLKWKGNSIFF